MKQKLLNLFKLRIFMFVALMCAAFTGAWADEESVTFSEQGYENGQAIESYEGTNFTITFNKGTNNNAPKYYTTGAAIRAYGGNYFTVTSDYTITDIALTFASGEGTNAITTDVDTYENGAWSGSANEVTFTIGGTSGHRRIASITVTFTTGGSSVTTVLTISDEGITNTDVYAGTEAGFLAATVSVKDGDPIIGATVTWSGNNDNVATIDAATGAVTLVSAGTVKFTAAYAGVEDEYNPSSATYEMTVINSDPNVPGSANKPYTVAQARAAIDAGTGVTGVYATGIVSKIVTAFNPTYGNISYNISEDGTEEADQLQAYRGFSYNGDWFTSADDIQVGDVVVIYGNLKKYNSTYEFDANNQLVSLDRPVVTTPSIELGDNIINAFAEGTDGVIIVDYKNITTVVAEVFFCDADGNAATYDWVTASINDINNLVYVIDANASEEPRTAYLKVHALDDDANDVYSELITINQAGYVAPPAEFATLPFSFDNGRDDIETTDGLTQEGLGSDYSSAPYLKFDGTGDYVVLAFDERPGKLTFDIKGNSFSGGTFTVQTSEDGTTYTDLETYTELGNTQSEEFNNLGEHVRYIKWIYTEKASGNVALGNIALAAYAEPVPVASITVALAIVEATEAETDGTLAITFENLTISGTDDFDVQFYDGEENETETPNWIAVEVAKDNDDYVVSYVIGANDGEARTAYFKVYAMDGEELVYSNLVTVNQAEYVAPGTTEQYALFTGDLVEGDYIIYYDGYAMNTTVENGRLQYAEVTPENDVITTDNAAIVWHIAKSGDYWTIYNAEADAYAASTGAKNKAQMLADGTDDMALWTVSGTEEYEFINVANAAANVNAYLRNNGTYGFACYATATGGALSLYKKVGDTPAPTYQAVTVSAAGYATLVAEQDLEIPANVEVFAVEIRGEWAHLEAVTAGIPAGEAVVVKAEAGEYVFNYAADAVEALTVTNDLIAATAPVTSDGSKYVLAKPQNAEIGFYRVKEGSTIAAGKAYLQSNTGSQVKAFYFADDDATGINAIDNGELTIDNAAIYNVAGQRVSKMQRGISIVNGKKVLVK